MAMRANEMAGLRVSEDCILSSKSQGLLVDGLGRFQQVSAGSGRSQQVFDREMIGNDRFLIGIGRRKIGILMRRRPKLPHKLLILNDSIGLARLLRENMCPAAPKLSVKIAILATMAAGRREIYRIMQLYQAAVTQKITEPPQQHLA